MGKIKKNKTFFSADFDDIRLLSSGCFDCCFLQLCPMFVWVLCGFFVWSIFCSGVICVISSFAIILEERAGCFTLIVFLLTFDS